MPTETKYREAVEATTVFAENLREIMDAKGGMSIAELARKADVDRSGLTNLLNGKGGNCTLTKLQKISDALGVPIWKMMKPRSKAAHKN